MKKTKEKTNKRENGVNCDIEKCFIQEQNMFDRQNIYAKALIITELQIC